MVGQMIRMTHPDPLKMKMNQSVAKVGMNLMARLPSWDEDNTSEYSSWSSDDDTNATDEVSNDSEGDWADIETTLSNFHQTLDWISDTYV
jgi:hypothetical protein